MERPVHQARGITGRCTHVRASRGRNASKASTIAVGRWPESGQAWSLHASGQNRDDVDLDEQVWFDECGDADEGHRLAGVNAETVGSPTKAVADRAQLVGCQSTTNMVTLATSSNLPPTAANTAAMLT